MSDKLDKIEAKIEKERGVFMPIISLDEIALLVRAVREQQRRVEYYESGYTRAGAESYAPYSPDVLELIENG